jgi:ATP-dependent helicase/nuclease subunit A
MLTVYRASAGSGKTFRLVEEYLRLLIANPSNYKHILAVTFTNKATNEMKSRILGQLFLLAGDKSSDYMKILTENNAFTKEKVRINARKVLKNILHDYNRFSISTIDSFTQRVIKAFNRETGISPDFTLGLDDDLILDQAVDSLLSGIDKDKQLLSWLTGFSEEKIMENRSRKIEDDIKSLGKELFKEKFQIFFPDTKKSVYTRENLESFYRELNKMISGFRIILKNKADHCMRMIRERGFSVDDFLYKNTGIGGYLKKLAEGIITEPNTRVFAANDSAEKWYSKSHKQKDRLGELVENQLMPALNEILVFYEKNEISYKTACEIKKELRVLGIITDLKTEIQDILQEKGILQLSDSNLLLSKIIGETDSPFIYEKIGTRFNYFMLDEFQDTSALQWKNFKPLIFNSLSEGHKNLLAGDVKQSIYRWRNSDWNILATQIESDFPNFRPVEIPLEKNWRSRHNIIEFNNAAISELIKALEESVISDTGSELCAEKFRNIYKHLIQEPANPGSAGEGIVEINFIEQENFEITSCGLLVEQVKLLQDNGFKAGEIAILVRKNREGAKIVETFLEAAKKNENAAYNLTVLSGESLFLRASRGVNFVMLVLKTITDPDNIVYKTALLHLWYSWLKPSLKNNANTSLFDNGNSQNTVNIDSGQWPEEKYNEDAFEQELGPGIKKIKNKIFMTSLDETVTEISSLFGLFRISAELPFLQALIDKAAEMKLLLSNDLSNFLLWWKEKGYETSVSINEEVDSVRLLTVHKAKGLEFEAVLIPFFNWETSWPGSLPPLLWCRPREAPFDRFPLLPVKAGKILKKTIFREDYFEEKVNSYIDTLNLVYVAFTRAKSALFVNCINPGENIKQTNNNSPGNSINRVLKYALDEITGKDLLSMCRDKDNSVFRYGELPVFAKKEDNNDTNRIKKYWHRDFRDRLRLRINSEEFIMKDKQNRSVKNTGKLVHEILAEIKTINDIEKACNKAFKEGKINNTEKTDISAKLSASLIKPELYQWFEGNCRIITERELLTPAELVRPDRIMIFNDKAVILDYKWGERIPEKHKSQVRRYVKYLKESGFNKVEGYLWYINRDEVERVC